MQEVNDINSLGGLLKDQYVNESCEKPIKIVKKKKKFKVFNK